MIVVVGHLTIDPAQRDAAVAAIAAAETATRAEDGNLEYRFSADLADPARINATEVWESREQMDAHMSSPALAEFMTAMTPLVTGSVSFTGYEVDSSFTII